MDTHDPFWALACINEGRMGIALHTMHSYAQKHMEAGTAFTEAAQWQDELCHLNSHLPERDDSPCFFPGTQLHVRGMEDEIEPVFVLDSELTSPVINVLHTNGTISQILNPRESGWQEAGQ